MSRIRARTNWTLLAIGVVSSACALVASYLYLVSPSTELSSARRRRKVMVASSSATELLDFIPRHARDQDDLYCTLLSSPTSDTDTDTDTDAVNLDDRCHYILRHEKLEGLTHIARHMSPDVLVILPSLAPSVDVTDIKDWVGSTVVVTTADIHHESGSADRNVKYVDSARQYTEVMKSV